MREFSVLIVEDDDDARTNMVDILSLDGYAIETAGHCLDAINAVESRHFDAVIVDWKLPDGDADYLIPLIAERLGSTPIIVVTGYRDFETAVKALRKGAYDFLLKPINPDALRNVLRRVQERRENLRQLEAAQQKLVRQERLAAIGQMVAGLAHESRNAFQRCHACLANLELDLRDLPESLELVHRVQRALDDVNQLLEEVRDYSAPIILERRDTDLASLIRDTWQQIMTASPAEIEPEFRIEMSEDFPNQVSIDRGRIQQVFRNLLENARFACPEPGQIQVDLTIQSAQLPRLCISVSDDGPGVPEPERETIFEPFFTTKTKGTGLGLAICRRIIEAHDGQLQVDGSELGGARFTLCIPAVARVREAVPAPSVTPDQPRPA